MSLDGQINALFYREDLDTDVLTEVETVEWIGCLMTGDIMPLGDSAWEIPSVKAGHQGSHFRRRALAIARLVREAEEGGNVGTGS